jgi:AcrR family transcriptional regulator
VSGQRTTQPASSRTYRKRKRAAAELLTRERITRATVYLHGTVGPARTTVKAIAELAGVQRATVYRHFPDEQQLFDACTAHYFSRHPMPDPHVWAQISAPRERLSQALADLYAWYGQTEQMISNSIRDIEKVPAATAESFLGYFVAIQEVLMKGRPERRRSRARVSAAIGHAIGFPTWRSLVREQGLRDAEAVALLAAMIDAAGATGAQPRASSATPPRLDLGRPPRQADGHVNR